jgi:hypothetical protein
MTTATLIAFALASLISVGLASATFLPPRL